jgi:predicted DsbA family dithiol-disulfide isomerase
VSLKPLIQKGIEIEWKAWKLPYNANPPAKPEGYGEEAKLFISKLLNETRLEIHPPSTKRDTYLAHIGVKIAKEKGHFDQYHHRIFQAVWVRDEDIEDVDMLCEVAREVGLNPEEFKVSLTNKTYINQVESDFQSAVDKQIWTIPSYIGSNGEIQVNHFKDMPNITEIEKII